MRILNTHYICKWTTLLTVLAFFASCENDTGKPGYQSQPKQVPVASVAVQQETTHKTYPAEIRGSEIIQIRPQVSGYIEKRLVDDGQWVEKGQPLFEINRQIYQQQVEAAQAAVAVARAQVSTAEMELEKQKPLVEKKIVGDYALTSAQYSKQSAEAALQQALAQLEQAKTNLGYSVVNSPTDGVLGIINYNTGALVSSTIAEPLVILTDVTPIRAYFAMNEKDFLQLDQKIVQPDSAGVKQGHVELILADGSVYPHKGVIDAVSGVINEATGSVSLRATFENPDKQLRSGASARIRIPNKLDSVLVVPQSATYEIQEKRFIYAVTDSNTVVPKIIEVLPTDDGKRFIVLKGLEPNERIVTGGINALKEGMKIQPGTPETENQQ